MIRSLLLSAAAIGSLSLGEIATAQTTVATDPVGFITLNVAGTNGTSSSALSFVGLSMTQPVALQGTLDGANGGTVTDNEAAWTDNQYNGATNGSHYIEILSGSGAGLMATITATSDSANSLTLDRDLSAFVTSGTSYRIRKNWTIASVFGANNESGLAGGTATTADQILVYNPNTQQYTTYYYKTSGLGGTGWRTTASTSVNAANNGLNPTDGIIIKRQQPSAIAVTLAGAVKLGQTAHPISTGLNILSNVYPTDTMTLGNSGLLASGLAGGTATTADQVQIYNPGSGSYDTYYYKTSGLGGTGWRSTASTTADASNAVIPSGRSIIVQRTQNRGAFTWVAPQPF